MLLSDFISQSQVCQMLSSQSFLNGHGFMDAGTGQSSTGSSELDLAKDFPFSEECSSGGCESCLSSITLWVCQQIVVACTASSPPGGRRLKLSLRPVQELVQAACYAGDSPQEALSVVVSQAHSVCCTLFSDPLLFFDPVLFI